MRWLPCQCCGYWTITTSFDICRICRWEDDPAQTKNPDDPYGANQVSLRQAQKNYAEFGACDQANLPDATRPLENDERDPDWKPLYIAEATG